MIKLENITKTYYKKVLNNINLELKENNIYLLKGISGSGKTTLLNIISNIDRDYQGKYYYNNKLVNKLNKKEQEDFSKNFSYVFQKSLLISHFNITENLLFIKNDIEKIETLAKIFDVDSLLYKMPSELSGGERQRIAIIRSLLLNTKVIILDEPTSNLDSKNALKFVEYINLLKNQNKIIIITTHSDIFDNIADEIININQGNIDINKINENKKNNIKEENKTLRNNKLLDLKYSFNKRKRTSIISLIFTSIIFSLTLLAISLKINFKDEYRKLVTSYYPTTTFSLTRDELIKLESQNIKYKIYKNYNYIENNIQYTMLLDKENTLMDERPYLILGTFPKNENEVLINETYLKEIIKKENINDEKILIKGNEFKITGVLSINTNIMDDIYSPIAYYEDIEKPTLYIKYNKISHMFEEKTSNYSSYDLCNSKIVITADKYDSKLENFMIENNISTTWSRKINELEYPINMITNLFLIILGIVSILLIFYISNQIVTELVYRKNEIGYLQLFGINKKRLKNILIIEYLIKNIIQIIISLIIYIISIVTIKKIININLMLNINYLLISVILMITYFITMYSIPINKYMKKSIKDLINDK